MADHHKLSVRFVAQYYNTICGEVDKALDLYSEHAVCSHGGPESPQETATGREHIKQLLNKWQPKGQVRIKTLDSQSTIDNGILLVVWAEILDQDEVVERQFLQSFLLNVEINMDDSEQPQFYISIRNDVFRFLDLPSKQATPPADPHPHAHHQAEVAAKTRQETTSSHAPQQSSDKAENVAQQSPSNSVPAQKEKDQHQEQHPPTETNAPAQKDKQKHVKDGGKNNKQRRSQAASTEPAAPAASENKNIKPQHTEPAPAPAPSSTSGRSAQSGSKGRTAGQTSTSATARPAPAPAPTTWASRVLGSGPKSTGSAAPAPTLSQPPAMSQPPAPASASVTPAAQEAPSQPEKGKQKNDTGKRGKEKEGSSSLFVKSIPSGVTEEQLRAAFVSLATAAGVSGSITNVAHKTYYAFVDFQSAESAALVLQESKKTPIVLENTTLSVEERNPPNQHHGGSGRGGGGRGSGGRGGRGGGYSDKQR